MFEGVCVWGFKWVLGVNEFFLVCSFISRINIFSEKVDLITPYEGKVHLRYGFSHAEPLS